METAGIESAVQRSCWALRIGLALQGFGVAAIALGSYSAFGSFLLLQSDWSAEAASRVDQLIGALLVIGGVWLLAAPRASVAAIVALVALAEVFGATLAAERFSHLVPATSALRVAAPLALALLCVPTPRRRLAAHVLLRLAIVLVVAGHGYEAWSRHPAFVDLILGFDLALGRIGDGWFGAHVFDPHIGLHEVDARALLVWIAAHDTLLAVLVLATRWRWVVLWVAIWAGAAALARPLAGGADQWFEAAARACNAAGPLALLWLVPGCHACATARATDGTLRTSCPPCAQTSVDSA